MSEHRHYFPLLDLIRGMAASFVLIYHAQHWLNGPGLAVNAGLAVDLFYCLSGFVLARVYHQRFDAGMPLSQFVKTRLVRLLPLIIVATLISGSYIIARSLREGKSYSDAELIIAIFFNSLSIPFFGASRDIGGSQLFPLNGPQYTIFFELFANIFWWATVRIKWRGLNFVVVGVACYFVARFGLGGDTADTFWLGFPRVLFSFFIGVIISNFNFVDSKILIRATSPIFIGCLTIVVFIFSLPLPYYVSWYVQFIVIALIFPLLVWSASRVRLSGSMLAVAVISGRLSYPVYILHFPIFCWVNGIYQVIFRSVDFSLEASILFVLVLAISFVLLKYIDEPFRSLFATRGLV
jgi:peptidoglycan/LPS O-acetylase OafA/YrhL